MNDEVDIHMTCILQGCITALSRILKDYPFYVDISDAH